MSPNALSRVSYLSDPVTGLGDLYAQRCSLCGWKRGEHSNRALRCPDRNYSRTGEYRATTFAPTSTIAERNVL
jgi:hypothetical protein